MIKDLWKCHKRSKPLKEAPGFRASFLAVVKASWLNVLLIFIPLSWIFHFVKLNNTLTFVFSFLAIIPLAKLHGFAAEELALRLGQTLAGLLNATLSKICEHPTRLQIIALVKCELDVVQSSMIGSILGNLLLVLGMCFFAGGTRFSEQGFGVGAAQLNSSLLTLSVVAVLLPAAFHNAVQPANGKYPLTDAEEGKRILLISHGVAIILPFIYVCYLLFQLVSHKELYVDHVSSAQGTVQYTEATAKRLHIRARKSNTRSSSPHPTDEAKPDDTERDPRSVEAGPEEDEADKPQMSVKATLVLLVVVTVLVAITAESLVDSIDGITSTRYISKEFVGLILLPIVGNAADYATAITVSVKDKLPLSIGIAVGSSIQIALLVNPFIVTLGWILGKPLTLLFDPFESIVLFLAVLTVNYVAQDGKSNWLEGMILMCLYVIVGITFWFYPGSDPAGVLASCT
ncbi:calcium/proton exchanger [Russula brevipes]|nr:calcium/proton exchanger [Russula brevipes]